VPDNSTSAAERPQSRAAAQRWSKCVGIVLEWPGSNASPLSHSQNMMSGSGHGSLRDRHLPSHKGVGNAGFVMSHT
jgi:hypothetical protein